MNIFITSPDPYKCAAYLDDKRVNKMLLETGQILSTVLRMYGQTDEGLYQATHSKHPCVVWAAETPKHFVWLYHHFIGLAEEYYQRSGFKTHKTFAQLNPIFQQYMRSNQIAYYIWEKELEFCNCSAYKDAADIFIAYQLTLADKWETDKITPRWNGVSK